MESKKDIGNYFKENLEQLDYSPSNKVWDGIEAELKQKRKRRFIFWLFFAAIAIGTISTYTYFHDFDPKKPSANSDVPTGSSNVTPENNLNSKNTDSNNGITKNENSNKPDLDTTSSDNSNWDNVDSNNINSKNTSSKKTDKSRGTKLVNSENSKSGKKGWKPKVQYGSNTNFKTVISKKSNAKTNSKNSVVTNVNDKNLNNSLSKPKKYKYKKQSKANQKKASLSAEYNKDGKNSKTKKKSANSNASTQLTTSNEATESTKSDDLSDNQHASNSKTNLNALKTGETKTATKSVKDRKQILEQLKKSNQKKRDSLIAVKKAEKENKDLTENPKEEEQKDSTKTDVVKTDYELTVAPYFGMNYTGNFGNGNFLNDSKTSKKESEINSSYGVLIRIMGSRKIGMQIGVGIINSVYSATFTKESNSFIGPNTASLTTSLQELNDLFPNQSEVISRQQTTFIEVPLEAYYVLSDKKFGMATSFGISFLKLQKNELFLESEDIDRMSIGKLENIAPFSSSINVKFNLFYKLTPKLNFDLYPSFQYQFMGYKDVSNYHPYFFSIKTGLSYKL